MYERGSIYLGGQKVIVKSGKATLENGTLAGSVLKLNSALKNFYNNSNIELSQLIAMVTSTPAKKLGLEIGELKVGFPADIVLFDSEFNILKVFIDGELKIS